MDVLDDVCRSLWQEPMREFQYTELLSGFVEALADHKTFRIRKAIGWALREYSKTDPEFVQSFVDSHPLSPLSRREALKVIQRSKIR